MPALPKLLVTAATIAYPLMVYAGFGRWDPFWLAVGLAALMLLRAWAGRDLVWLIAAAGAAVLALATRMAGSWVPLKLYPVMVSGILLAVFAASVLHPPTIIERIARLAEPELPAHAVAYTRRVTLAWCTFFAFNGSIALATVVWGSEEVWLLYNGLVSYALVGLMFAGEWMLRQRMRARIAPGGAGHG